MKDKFSKFINLQGKYLTSLLFVLLLGIGQMWADDIYYVAMVQNVAEDGTLSGTSGTLKVVKYTASTEKYAVTDAVSWSLNSPSVGCKGSSVSKCSDISDYTKWQQGSGSQKAKGPKFSGTTTLSLGSLTATKITFVGYRNSSSGGTLQVGSGDAKTTAKKPSSTFTSDCVVEYTGSFTGDVSVVASAEHAGVFVITVPATTPTNYTVTINPNDGSYAETPDGWTYSAGVYTKSIASGTSFTAPAGLTKGTDDLSWKDGDGNAITFPVTISSNITFVAQWTAHSASSDATLKALEVAGCTLNETFDPDEEDYTINLPFYASMPVAGDVTATKNDANAEDPEVSISSNVITIHCEAEDGTEKDYTITVTIAPTPTASSSINIEQLVLDNGKSYDIVSALTAANIVTDGRNGLDSLNDVGKTNRNYAYLGLKLKKANADIIKIVVPAEKALNVKFGNVGVALTTTINGVAGSNVAKKTDGYSSTFHLDAAAVVREVVFHSSENQTVTLQQVKIDADVDPITLPWLVTYDAGEHGTCATAKEVWTGTALTLPAVTPEDGWDFDGWFDGETQVTSPYNPGKNAALEAHYTAQASPFDLTALTYQIGSAAAQNVGYVDGTFTYNIELPYAPSYDAITVAPTLKEATSSIKAGAELTVSSLPGTATFTVVEAGGANEQLYTVNFSKAAKDGACLIKVTADTYNTNTVTPTGAGTGWVSLSNGSSEKSTYDTYTGYKMNTNGRGIRATLAEGNFQENDVVEVFVTDIRDGKKLQIFSYDGSDYTLQQTAAEGCVLGANRLTMGALSSVNSLAVYRDGSNGVNPDVAYLAVYRAQNPVLKAMTINGENVVINEAAKTATVAVPYDADLNDLTVVPTIVWNAPAASGSIVINNGSPWIEGENTYKLTDKDGDATTYTITLSIAPHYEAQIGSTKYATLVAAVAAANADETVQLLDNVDLMATGLTIAENITLDLNGFNIKAGEQLTNNINVPTGVKLTLVDNSTNHLGKIYTEEAYTSAAACGVIRVAGEFLMQSGNIYTVIESDPANKGQFAVVINAGGKVTVEGGQIKAGWYAISNNGLNSGSTIIVSGGELISTVDYAIYNPSANSTVTVSGGVVYGAAGGIVMNRGDLTVTGGIITSNNQGTTGTWGDGTGGLGNAAIYANGKYESVTVEISGGTVVAEGGAIMITNGTMNPVEIAISGGQFSHVVPAEYCAPGFEPITTPNAQGKYEVEDVRIYIFDGSTMSNMAESPSTGAITWAKVGDTMGAGDKDKTYQDVHYTRALSCGKSSTTKHFRIDVAENNNAKIEVIGMSNSSSDTRRAWLTNSTEKGEYADAIAGLETTGYNPEMFATDWLEEGSYYLHADNTVAIFLIRVTPKAVDPKCEAPVIDAQPVSKLTFGPTENLTTSVTAHVSEGSLSYQWYNAADNSKVDGATSATLTTTTEGTYYVIVTNTLASHRDNSTKSDEATLAYRDATDATLSALSYGDPATAITLVDNQFEYNVYLPEGTTIVPTLSATATMHPYPTVTISDATEFVSYEATSTVTVKSEDETVTNTYTVIFHVAHSVASLVDVTENTTWDWTTITARADGSAIDVPSGTKVYGPSVTTEDGLVLANYVLGGDNWDKIEGNNGAYAIRSSTMQYYQGASLRIHTTVPGYLMIRGRNDGSNMTLKVQNAGRDIELGALPKDNFQDFIVFVEAGDVVMYNVPATEGKPMRIGKIEFTVRTNPTPDYTRTEMLGEGVLGTICLPNNVPAGAAFGATFYELQGRDYSNYGKLAFDEIVSGELEAGKPYVFLAHGDVINIYYGATHVDAPVNGNGMYGTFEPVVLKRENGELDDVYYFAQRALWSCDGALDLTIAANRAYVKLSEIDDVPSSAPAAGRRRILLGVNGENSAQGFENIESGDKPMKVMIEGTMYILRGEKVFDATGRLVK